MKINPFRKNREFLDYSPHWVRVIFWSGKIIAFILLIAFTVMCIINSVKYHDQLTAKELISYLPAFGMTPLILFIPSRIALIWLPITDLILTIYKNKYDRMVSASNRM